MGFKTSAWFSSGFYPKIPSSVSEHRKLFDEIQILNHKGRKQEEIHWNETPNASREVR